jgi:regulatory protein
MKITALRAQTKNSQRVSVFVDEKYSFSLSLDELVKYRLKRGDELGAAEVKKYKKLSADGKLRARALEWLLNRPHSEMELRDYLYRKKAEPEMIENLVAEFSQKKYLDDSKFAQWFIELQSRRGKSNRAIRAELFSKGISREVANRAIGEGEESEEDRLKILMAKKAKLPRYQKDPQKLAQYLTGQGFSYHLVKEQLKIDQPEA